MFLSQLSLEMAKLSPITSDVGLWVSNSLPEANFSTLKKKKAKNKDEAYVFWVSGTERWCWKALVFRHFPSDFCAVPNLHVSTVCISLVWNWLVAAWICHQELQWLGFRETSAYFCWCCTVPGTPSNVTWVCKWCAVMCQGLQGQRFLFEEK